MKRAARVDGNQRALVALARQLGAVVVETFQVGQGCPDLFLWQPARGWAAVEIKTESGAFTPAQVELQQRAPIVIWRTATDVLGFFGCR